MTGLLLALAAAAPAAAGPQIPLQEYRARREALRASLGESTLILFGRTGNEAEDSRDGFFQEPNFQYLTGWREPGAILVLFPSGHKPGEMLLLPRRSERRDRWTGRKAAPDDPDILRLTGFEAVEPAESFETLLPKVLEAAPKIATLLAHPAAAKLRALAPLREFSDAAPLIARQRMKKSAAELALIERAVEATVAAHQAAWKRASPGLTERQLGAVLIGAWMDCGCQRSAYPPIIASGPNAVILHYFEISRRMEAGELVLIDAGAECDGYAADITRTIPVSGRFTPRQRELYEIVLGAHKAALAAVKPGATLARTGENSIYRVALAYLDSHGKDRAGNPLGKYFPHGIGHHIGLEVHDANDPAAPLEAGMVVTIEPGLYLPEEGVGIRIEDVVLVTETGSRVLSGELPKEAEAVERALRR